MSIDTFSTAWTMWLAIAGGVTLAAAALLVTIALLARRISRLGLQALAAVTAIERQTRVIWQLNATNQVATQLAAGARSIRDHGIAIAQALDHAPASQTQARAPTPPAT
ncbi:MAG: hypothetical protein M3485_05985 [Pseudomonadota bacterium]|nr:hypothetical protein [Pseudomonadota bacterium]